MENPSHEFRRCTTLLALTFLISIAAALLPTSADAVSVAHSRIGGYQASAPSPANVISLWGGARSSIALRSDGTVWTWGANDCGLLGSGICGKLGDGTQISRSIPIQVHGPGNSGYLTNVNAIMAGEHENYALRSDGTVWSWGGNFAGQLGNGTYTNTTSPVQVSGLVSVTALGGRGYHTLAIRSDGTVWAWGWNEYGELGHDTSGSHCPYGLALTCSNVPVQVIGVSNPLTVTGGGFFSLALMPDHTLLGWGRNSHGELGNGSFTVSQTVPVQVSNVLSNVTNVSAGWFHAVALTSHGKVWTWGDNAAGEIGIGVTSTTGVSVPVQVPGLSNVIGVSAGDGFTGILKADGSVWTWGGNNFGDLGDGTNVLQRSNPTQVAGLTNVINYAARDYHNIAARSDGSVWAWGSGSSGELGDNKFADSNVPVRVIFLNPQLYLPFVSR